jgi:hypothetical protein
MPAAAVGVTFAGLVLAYHFLVAPWMAANRPVGPEVGPATPGPLPFSQYLHRTRQYLGEGSFRLAVANLEQARTAAGSGWPGLPRSQRQEWMQLHRQAALLADLLAEPLEDVVRHAAGIKEAEWVADFRQRYHGRAVVFDMVVQRVAGRRLRHNYCLATPMLEARLELGGLALLRGLPLDQPQRLVFGARLAGVTREPPGTWVIRPEPDSGVLLTDPGAAAACCAAFGDPGTQALLKLQTTWAADDRGEIDLPANE